jgi:hypothetical protein
MKKTLLIASLFGAFAAQSQCSDLFFSEYEEGSSSNKAFEVYNPTSAAIDLVDYVIYRANNGSTTPTDSLFPVGLLLPGDVFVTGNPSAIPAIMAQSDTTHTLTFYNGDDAMWIEKISTGDTLDIIGIVGVDPGSGWPVGTGATNNFTLIRKIGIQQGQLNWAMGATEWDVYPIDMTDSLGMHSMTICAGCLVTGSVTSAVGCDSVVSPSGNYIWTVSNTYGDTIPNAAGCDSLMSIQVVINYSNTGSDVVTMCDSLMWIDGNTYYADNNIATHMLSTMSGCDSLVTLDLTLNYSDVSTDVIAACDSMVWLDGNTYYADNNTATFATVTAGGCDSIISLDLTIAIVNIGVANTDPTLTATALGAAYQWVDCDNGNAPIVGETGQSFTPVLNGSYAVEVTESGCTATSACEDVFLAVGLDEYLLHGASLYPNPTKGMFTIDLATIESVIDVRVMNVNGQVVSASNHLTTDKINLDLTIDAGVYFVNVKNGDGFTARFKLIVR